MSWLLDADVLSQPAKQHRDPRVVEWLRQEREYCSLRMLLKTVSLPPKLHLAVPVNKRSALGTPRKGGQKFLQI